jgi:uncharacterized membrane protein
VNPLNSVRGTVVLGVVLAVVVMLLAHQPYRPHAFSELGFAIWLHMIAGVMWVGLLYYFNVVQAPALALAAADTGGPGGAGITRYIVPRALLWFRWAAVVTWVTGVWYLARSHRLADALILGMPDFGKPNAIMNFPDLMIGIGAYLGTIMLVNVWLFIWPSQKKILGIVPATDDEKARARRLAARVSRVNFALSIPLLLCMGASNHSLPF